MNREQYNSEDLKSEFTHSNLYNTYNVGNILQSIQENGKKCSGYLNEEKELKAIFKDLHWLYRLGVDVYRKKVESLDQPETLWTLGIIMHICKGISQIEGPIQSVAGTLRTNYYRMAVWLRQHYDSLQTPVLESKNDEAFKINSSSVSDNKPVYWSDTDTSDFFYSPLSFSLSNNNSLLPDPLWWSFTNSTEQRRNRVFFDFVFNTNTSPYGAVDNTYILGQAIRFEIESSLRLIDALENKVPDMVHQVISTGMHGIERGINITSHSGHQLIGNTCNSFYNCGEGICNTLGNCLSGAIQFLQCDCNCGNVNCEGGDCGSGCGICCTGICGAGLWCSNLCCGCTSDAPADTGNGGGNLLNHGGLVKAGAGHLSVPLTDFFSNTIGGWLTGGYSLLFGTPAAYVLLHSMWKSIRGGERPQTRRQDRVAGIVDFVTSASLGAGLFFGGWFIPFGGPHTAVTFGIFGIHTGKKLTNRYRKVKSAQTYGKFPSVKVEKYALTRKELEALYGQSEEYQQPGMGVAQRQKHFQKMLVDFKMEDKQFEKSPAEFFTAQEQLENVSLRLREIHTVAKQEKDRALNRQGLCGLYFSLYNGAYRKSERRKDALTAIQQARSGEPRAFFEFV